MLGPKVCVLARNPRTIATPHSQCPVDVPRSAVSWSDLLGVESLLVYNKESQACFRRSD